MLGLSQIRAVLFQFLSLEELRSTHFFMLVTFLSDFFEPPHNKHDLAEKE